MKLAFISDTHLVHERETVPIPECDILVHSGDATWKGTPSEIRTFFSWLADQPAGEKLFIAGNHDWLFEKDDAAARRLIPKGVTYLRDEEALIRGIRFFGSPWQPRFLDWAFNKDRGPDIREVWARIPDGLDVLVTHGPPRFILDWTVGQDHVGCSDLAREVLGRIRPKIHAFGHIHHAYGVHEEKGTLFLNASTVNEAYRFSNDPILVDWQNGKPSVLHSRSKKPSPSFDRSNPGLWH